MGAAFAVLTSVGAVVDSAAAVGAAVDSAAAAVVVSGGSAVTPAAAGLGSGIAVAAASAAGVEWSTTAVSEAAILPPDSCDPPDAGCSVAPQPIASAVDKASRPKKINERVDMVLLKSLQKSGWLAPRPILAQNSGVAKAMPTLGHT